MSLSARRALGRTAFLALALGLWFLSQQWIGGRAAPEAGVGDAVHQWTSGWNTALAARPGWTNALLIVSSLGIDVTALALFLWGILGASSRPLAGVLVLFALRQAAQATTALPTPPGMLWRDPGFPSLFVTYAVGNDFFFSGHTAIAVFGALAFGRRSGWAGRCALAAFALGEAVVVLVLRAHYTLDVLTGAAMATMVWLMVKPSTREKKHGA
jgi:hypothetical protein